MGRYDTGWKGGLKPAAGGNRAADAMHIETVDGGGVEPMPDVARQPFFCLFHNFRINS